MSRGWRHGLDLQKRKCNTGDPAPANRLFTRNFHCCQYHGPNRIGGECRGFLASHQQPSGDAHVAEPSRRIIVDGVDFANVFQFQRILRAIAMAMQPARLGIALLMVTALISAGKLWDGATAPTFGPNGFLHGAMTEDEARTAQDVYRQELRAWGLTAPSDDVDLDGRAVHADIHDAYVEQAAEIEDAVDEDAARKEALNALAEGFRETANAIEGVRPLGTYEAMSRHLSKMFTRSLILGTAQLDINQAAKGAYGLLITTPVMLWDHDRWFAVVYGLLFVIVVALGGGAIARMAAAEIATGERLRIRDAVDFALESWVRLIFTPLLPLIILAVLCLVLAVSGAVAFLPWLDVLGGVLYGLALLIGFIIAVLLIGYVVGFSLLIPAVAVENCDAADAQHRAYAYVLSRPFHLLGYGLVAIVGLTLGFLFVSFFAMILLNVTAAMVGIWSDNPAITAGGEATIVNLTGTVPDQPRIPLANLHERWAASGVMLWHTLVVSLVVAYVVAYYFAASTIVYLLIRKKCDGQDITEIWRPGMIPGTVTPTPDQDQNEPVSA